MLDICRQFQLPSPAVSCMPYGSGLINQTYRVTAQDGGRYILQRLSREAFQDIPGLMENVAAVTSFLAARETDARRCLHLRPTVAGRSYLTAADGACYRMYDFIEGGVCLDQAEQPQELYACAYAFGRFQRLLADFPAATLHETIPHFHDTLRRYAALRDAVQQDRLGRVKECGPELAFIWAREKEAGSLMAQWHAGVLPLRVTHNDTKLNNVMLDAKTHQGLCVLDLDTVMPGLAAFDFGDLVRSGANTGAEDETNLQKVGLSLESYRVLHRGFLDACGDTLTEAERTSLTLGGKLMTLECGVRFLTDYFSGDTYFRVHRPQHNLERCRCQLQLVRSMEVQWDAMVHCDYQRNPQWADQPCHNKHSQPILPRQRKTGQHRQ